MFDGFLQWFWFLAMFKKEVDDEYEKALRDSKHGGHMRHGLTSNDVDINMAVSKLYVTPILSTIFKRVFKTS